MSDWKTVLNGDPTGWLLESSDPSVRYFTLRWLLDCSQDDPEVIRAAESVVQSAPVRKLLASQRPAVGL